MASFTGGWQIYDISRDEDSILYPRLKLMAPPGTPQKWGARRTFRLHWSITDLRFVYHGETKLLREQYPELAREVELWLTLNRDSQALRLELAEYAAGASSAERLAVVDAEIRAERARLEAARERREWDAKQRRRDERRALRSA